GYEEREVAETVRELDAA
uniref:Conantokin-Qu n=1 Tax=Conus quercinus TaxID=101313 RepID=CKQ_CONQU|nr:RecName: Full=Conantokin-Qu; Short=Con-Qu [Conus quercinus]